MLYYGRIDVSEGINVNKTSKSKECDKSAIIGIFLKKALNFKKMSKKKKMP